jgi:hypothetical protein
VNGVNPGRIVETGFIPNFRPREFAVVFDSFPSWLLAMERSFCSHLHIMGWSSAASLKMHLEANCSAVALVHKAIAHLGLGRVSYSTQAAPPAGALILVSGSPAFLQAAAERYVGRQVLMIGTSHCSAKRPPPGPARVRLAHRSFGGPTHFVALFGCHGIACVPTRTVLRRTVGHIFEFGVQPDPLEESEASLLAGGLTIDDILHPFDLSCPIIHRTSFFRSGWGTRVLSPDELGIAFGFPAWLRAGDLTTEMFPCVPLQIMDACIRDVLDTQGFVSPLAPQAYPPPEAPTESTWMPGIQRHLPHTWVPSAVITDKAVKHDNAAVQTAMWDNRVTLLYSWSISRGVWILDFFRRRLMLRYRYRLLTEFRTYMRCTHGVNWSLRLMEWRSTHGSLKRKARAGAQPGRKRHKGGENDGKEQKKEKEKEGENDGKEEKEKQKKTESDIVELAKDADVGQDIIFKATQADWWNWAGGSTLIFWRWPCGFQRRCARDGMPAWIQGTLPRFKRRAKVPSLADATLLAPKFLTILERRYVLVPDEENPIKSLVAYFHVPKAKDIRPVYNGKECGINDALWAPGFWLPIGRSAVRVLDFEYHSVDIDLGEFFLNFPYPEILRLLSGIDLTPFAELIAGLGFKLKRDSEGMYKVYWSRCWMGCKPSPFFAVRFYYWAEEFARGHHSDPKNYMRWDFIRLNLPGDPSYNPTKPRVMKWDDSLQKIAGDIVGFVDDLRASGYSMEYAWGVARQVASRLQYLGIQDAPRKRRPPSQFPGA